MASLDPGEKAEDWGGQVVCRYWGEQNKTARSVEAGLTSVAGEMERLPLATPKA